MKILINKNLNPNSNYLVIPFLESIYKKKGSSITELIKNALNEDIDAKYNDLCNKLDLKFRDSNINIATLTISLSNSKPVKTLKLTNSKKTKKQHSEKIHSEKANDGNEVKKANEVKKVNLNTIKNNLLQIYMVRINDNDDNKTNELLEELRVCGHLIFNLLKSNYIRNVNLSPELELHNKKHNREILIKALLEGIMLSSYKFDKYKTSKAVEIGIVVGKSTKTEYHLDNIFIVSHHNSNLKNGENAKDSISKNNTEISRLDTIVKCVFLARDIINEPANDNRSDRFIATIKTFIKTHNIPVELEVWDVNKLHKLGMGLIIGVGKGSNPENAPCILIIKYAGNHALHTSGAKGKGNLSGNEHADKPDWVLLGKGITFDTGGLDLKKGKDMLDMKSDLSGAAAVVAFLLGYAMFGGKHCIYTMCPFAENNIGAGAVKPTDVLTAYDGRTVEIVDTDAEGRLVLADTLAYVTKKWPSSKILDMATLTGQAESVSGKAFSCVLSVNAERETDELIKKSLVINEALVRLPMLEKELDKLESKVADIKNVNYESSADIIMSSVFMRQFIGQHTKWIHVDIAGPAFGADKVVQYASPEASGVGVRLLMEYFSK